MAARKGKRALLTLTVTLAISCLGQANDDGGDFFEKKVRPILAENCFRCHGPERQKANLRLDSLPEVLRGGDRGPEIVPGDPEKSRIIEAVRYANPRLQMPPRGKLGVDQVEALIEWVKRGAPWPGGSAESKTEAARQAAFDLEGRKREHWAWRPVQPVEPPGPPDLAANPIDRFVLARLAERGLEPAPPAEKGALLRRVRYDLTGLPPDRGEIEAFLADSSPDAFEKVVDRLLASPQFGERWARHWLDLARYAETLGHEFDYQIHEAWRYRDYVVRALNADLPYDRFITEQIAGDLIVPPRLDPETGASESVLGTVFFRMVQEVHSPVDVRVAQADRIENQIDVLTKTFLGLTVACARCHDHKFDAISTRDYYGLYGILESSRATLSSIDRPGAAGEKAGRLRALKGQIRSLVGEAWSRQAEEAARKLAAAGPPGGSGGAGGAAASPTDGSGSVLFGDSRGPGWDGWLAEGPAFAGGPARAGDFLIGDRDRPVREFIPAGSAHGAALSRRLWGVLRSPTFTIESRFIHLLVAGRASRINLVIDGFILIRDPIYGGLKKTLEDDRPGWHTFDLAMWKGRRAYLELSDVPAPDPADGKKSYPPDGYVNLVRVVASDGGQPTPAVAPRASPPGPDTVREAVDAWRLDRLGDDPRGPEKAALLVELLRNGSLDAGPEAMAGEAGKLAALLAEYAEVERSIEEPVLIPAMTDGTGEDERVFIRGDPRNLGPVVKRRFLEALDGPDPLSIASGSGRLELAQRIADPRNPLTARVMVNRIWHHLFGRGLVTSVDNFGKLGQPPTDPRLLDYIAGRFVQEGWSQKKLIRLLVTSRAYRQSSRAARPEDDERDPLNECLHRMPRRRLEGEAIRDGILAISGSLDRKLYGPPVPIHITEFMDGTGRPDRSGPPDGERRRSLYQEVRRNFLSPFLQAFDAPVPASTVGERTCSNVPAQALILMNDPFVAEEARRWAERLLAEGAREPRERLEDIYLAALGRRPSEREAREALEFLAQEAEAYGVPPAERPSSPRAWADLCHVVFNLKEFIFID
jgi:uncharacterized protein DUF1553/uncharacterized protein DUF1549/cytochrome c